MVPVVTVPTRAAKPVKDALKQAGWLHASLKPQVGSASVSFPLADGAGPAVEAALGADATLRGSGAAVGFLARDGLAAKKQVPPQGRAAAAPRAGAGGYAPARQAPAPCPVAAPPQERSFGSGSQQRLQTSALPPALPVRRVACAAGTSHSWLAQHVYSGRAPAILTGADLGPCVQNWSAARLAKARCAVPRVSVHVCASAAVDLAGHRRPNTPRNFVFRSMPFAEAVARCAMPTRQTPATAAAGEERDAGSHAIVEGEAVASGEGKEGEAMAASLVAEERGAATTPGGLAAAAATASSRGATAPGSAATGSADAMGEGALGAASVPAPAFPPLLAQGERYYLRSVGLDPRKQAADFPSLFPELAAECWLVPRGGAREGPILRGEAREGQQVPADETPLRQENPRVDRPPLTDPSSMLQSGETDLGKQNPRVDSPPLIDPAAYHSSVLRVASDETQLWAHFDTMDNALAQITGHKRVVLWPPPEDEHLYVDGSSSRVSDVDAFNDEHFPLFRRSIDKRLECILAPGEVLFLPALWFHSVTSIGFSVAVNVFWRSHHHSAPKIGVHHDTQIGREPQNGHQVATAVTAGPSPDGIAPSGPSPSEPFPSGITPAYDPRDLYDPKDLYGNRDPPAAAAAMAGAAAAVAALRRLPPPFRAFYARRAARLLLEVADGEDEAQGEGAKEAQRKAQAQSEGGAPSQGGEAAEGEAQAHGKEKEEDHVEGQGTSLSSLQLPAGGARAHLSPVQAQAGGLRALLSSGHTIPLLGLGTWQLPRDKTGDAVTAGIDAGIRHLDCAPIYGNEEQVGDALHRAMAEGRARRGDLFVTTKLWGAADMAARAVKAAATAKEGGAEQGGATWEKGGAQRNEAGVQATDGGGAGAAFAKGNGHAEATFAASAPLATARRPDTTPAPAPRPPRSPHPPPSAAATALAPTPSPPPSAAAVGFATAAARASLVRSLRALKIDRADLLLMHWPPAEDALLLIAWAAMEGLVAEGLVSSIGVANFSERRLRLLLDRARNTEGGDAGDTAGAGAVNAGDTVGGGWPGLTGAKAGWQALPSSDAPLAVSPTGRPTEPSPAAFPSPRRLAPAVNQIEAHPGFRNDQLLAFCAEDSIHVTAFCPLGGAAPNTHSTPADAAPAAATAQPPSQSCDRSAAVATDTAGSPNTGGGHAHLPHTGWGGVPLLSSPQVLSVATRLSCSPAQALLRWGVMRGCSVIPKSDHPSRIRHNAAALNHAEFSCRSPEFSFHSQPAPWPGDLFSSGHGDGQPALQPEAGGPGAAGDEVATLAQLNFVASQMRRVRGEAFVTGGKRGARFASLAALWEEEGGGGEEA